MNKIHNIILTTNPQNPNYIPRKLKLKPRPRQKETHRRQRLVESGINPEYSPKPTTPRFHHPLDDAEIARQRARNAEAESTGTAPAAIAAAEFEVLVVGFLGVWYEC